MRLVFKILLAVLVIGPVAALGAARASLPQSVCAVSHDQMQAIKLEISHADVVSALGCDGIVVTRRKLGAYTFETRAWRGTAWPYGIIKGEFIDGVLHGTEISWLNLKVSDSSP